MLSNAYFIAKFSFDTAENEPAKNSQRFGSLRIQVAGGRRLDPAAGRGDLPRRAQGQAHRGGGAELRPGLSLF